MRNSFIYLFIHLFISLFIYFNGTKRLLGLMVGRWLFCELAESKRFIR